LSIKILDPIAIYEAGLADLSRLQGVERLVFMLQDFDNLMDMEGWDEFFCHEWHFDWFSEMKEWLHAIGDTASLAVLASYETYLKEHDVTLSPTDISHFLESRSDSPLKSEPDWREQYGQLRSARWARALTYLDARGITLSTGRKPD
jgi:hypothetical protein